MIQGISHLTFVVKDLEKMTEFLTYVFNAQEVYFSEESTFSVSKEKFFLLNGLWIAIMEGEPLSQRTYNHVAFQIPLEKLAEYTNKVKSLGLDIKEARGRIAGEGQSLYFYDFDNHLFELHTGTLEERLRSYSQTI